MDINGYEAFYLLSFPLLPAGFLLGLLSNPENGGDVLIRNVGRLSADYTALYPRRQNSPIRIYF
jgi:hypothetical protein